jgi:hypothetical protein
MTPTNEATQPRPFSNYDPTKYRSAHLRAAVFLCFMFGFILSAAALLSMLIVLGLGAWRQVLLISVGAFLVPFVALTIPALQIVGYLGAHYHPDARPEATMRRPREAAQPTAVQIAVDRPRPPLRMVQDVSRPPLATPMPAPVLSASHPTELPAPSSIQEEINTMPRLERPDPETGYADVPALDVRHFIKYSEEGQDPGSPALRDWLGRTLPSGKQMTRRYWEKLTDVAARWGRLYKGASGEASRILPAKNAASEPEQ